MHQPALVARGFAARATKVHPQLIRKVFYMAQLNDQKHTLRVSSNGKESVDIQLESSSPVTVRLQIDGGSNCQHGTENRPGSYIDSDLGIR